VATRLDKQQRYGYTLTLPVKYADYQPLTRAQTATGRLRAAALLYSLGKDWLREHRHPNGKVSLLGLTVSNLTAPTRERSDSQLQRE
jgi:DNA polymerase-4